MNGQNLVGPRGRRRRRGTRRSGSPPGPRGRTTPVGVFGTGTLSGGLRGLILDRLRFPIFIRVDFGTPPRTPPLPPGALSQAQPAQNVPQPRPTPGQPRFPTGPAANDPVFRRVGFGTAGRLLGVGGLLIAGVQAAIAEIERRQREDQEEILREQRRETEEINRQARRRRELEALRTDRRSPLPDPIQLPRPDIVILPQQVPLPVPVSPLPSPQTLPVEIPQPGPAAIPSPVAIPAPVPPPAASPSAPPVVPINPVQFPSFDPIPFLPFGQPFTAPSPVNVPIGSPSPLTGFGPGSVPSQQLGFIELPQAVPQPQPQRCPQRKCDDDLDQPRTECFKGLYREGVLDTDFTSWTEIDCITGREIGRREAEILQFPEI